MSSQTVGHSPKKFIDKSLSVGDLVKMNNGYHKSALLHFAHDQRLFSLLRVPIKASDVAKAYGWSPRKASIMLDGLCAHGLIEREKGGRYVNSATADRYLVPGESDFIGGIIDHQRLQWPLWSRIGEVLAADQPLQSQQELRFGSDSEANTAFQCAMISFAKGCLDDVMAQLGDDEATRALDVCGGHGTYLCALAQANEHLVGEVWDLPQNRQLAEANFRHHGVSNRLRFSEKNVNDADSFVGVKTVDVCFLNDCLHYFDEAGAARLIGRAAEVLSVGGRLVVTTMTLERDRSSPREAAQFSLHMMVNTGDGGLHPTDWIADTLRSQGLAVTRCQIGPDKDYTMLTGHRHASSER